jgi:hypothetical protein
MPDGDVGNLGLAAEDGEASDMVSQACMQVRDDLAAQMAANVRQQAQLMFDLHGREQRVAADVSAE